MTMTLSSPAFSHHGMMARRHTCDGDDLSPPLTWDGVPAAAQSLALIMDDPDAPDPAAPTRTWVHWVVYNVPPWTSSLPEGAAGQGLSTGGLQGVNDWLRTGYGGPCPPVGTHRYVHKLFALDCRLADLKTPTKAALKLAMQGHVLARAELIGLYRRQAGRH
ncbi:YbhB/YbcL family Raf kinase inhibitor-like protein [Rhodoferax sp.]|uniref:YbhB/YbcL family Raf kinase inhibitor-like protein n=1 Tax=Rhodoferax sp. TaxID=50421 RepID=UPI002764534B|nr:YbhB/YbcL family Raf kinase inhibitor-like protein [Rhodoferax sp.]